MLTGESRKVTVTISIPVSGIPCPVPYVANGTVSPSVNVVDGQTLRVDCYPGFALTGSSIFNCGQSAPPTCVSEYSHPAPYVLCQ